MKEIFTSIDVSRVGLYKSMLDEAGIACFVRNEAMGTIGGLIIPALYPVLCVANDIDFDRAKAVLDSFREPVSTAGAEWICPKCGSKVPAGFDTCWNCERERAAPPA